MSFNEIVLSETLARREPMLSQIHGKVLAVDTSTTPNTADVRPFGDVVGVLFRVPVPASLTIVADDVVSIGRGVDARDLVVERSFGNP